MRDRGLKSAQVLGGVLALLILIPGLLRLGAQQYFGTIVGTVTDPSGAAVPDASVTVTNPQTAISRQVKTDDMGNYRVESLVPGTYTLKVEHSGFETAEVQATDLPVARTVTVNVVMRIGAVTQTVEVQAAAPLLDTANSTVGTVVNNKSVVNLPLNGRAYTDLLLLVPGSVPNGAIFLTAGGGQNYSVSGNRSEQNNFTLDGVYNNEEFFKQFAIQPSIDAIQEFKVQTNVVSAEFGQAAGANVTVATKSGTNQLHGDVYEFLRNDKLDAADFFGNKFNTRKSAFRQNQFGVTGGGPVVLPHLYNGKDRTFWFFSYEGLRIRRAATNTGTIPTTAQLGGDLRDQPPIFDPATTRADPNNPGAFIRDRLSCNGVLNVICPDRIDPIVAAYAAIWYPKTDTLGAPAPNLIVTTPFRLNQYQYNARMDHKIKDNLQFFGRFTNQHAAQVSPYSLPINNNTLINSFVNAEASLTWLVGPTTVVDFKSAYNRTNLQVADNNPAPGAASFLAAHPIQGTPLKSTTVPLYPSLGIAGYTSPNQSGFPFPTNVWHELASLSMIRGKHSIRVGFELKHMNNLDDGLFTSIFNFDKVPTADPQNVSSTGSALASYLLGLPSSGLRNLGTTAAYMHQTNQNYYLQDDVKLTPKLTINAGLRYEYDQWPYEKYNHLSMFDFGSKRFVWAGNNPLTGQGPNIRRGIVDPDFNNFAPRLGLAYQVTPRTTVRSGFGVFYAANYLWEIQGVRGSWPYAISETFSSENATLPDKPLETFMPSYISPVPGTPANSEHTVGRTDRTSYTMQWNLGVQRELARDLLLEVNYVGNGGRKLPIFTNINDPPPGPGLVGSPSHPRPYQFSDPLAGTTGLGAVSQITNLAISNYNGLQVKVEKKFSTGLQFLASYAWSHYIDLGGSGFSQSAAPQNDSNFRADRANGTFDFRHVFTANWYYELPFGRDRRFLAASNRLVNAVLGGWQWTGITHFNTGGPLNIYLTFDNANVGQRSLSQRPNYTGGPQRTSPAGGDKTVGYLDANAFVVPPPFTYGNLGRNSARNLGLRNWDTGLYKSFAIRENKESVQFRAEFFNVLNHVNLGGIDSGVDDPAFGTIGGTQNRSREIQFALKFYF